MSDARAAEVQAMFGRVAARYNLLNSLMTMGQAGRWRRHIVEAAGYRPGDRVLDLATGTGDLAFDAVRAQPAVQVVGADFAMPMMTVGRTLPLGDRVAWAQADALALPFADERFDVVTHGYLMRNVVDLPGALAEQFRVLRPGGRLVALETSPPPPSPVRPFVEGYIRYGFPLLGRLVGSDPGAYSYLQSSTRGFLPPDEVAALMRDAGFVGVSWRTYTFGSLAVHTARKPTA